MSSRIKDVAARAAGAAQGGLDAVKGTTYEPRSIGDLREVTEREKGAYWRWRAGNEPRNAYERAAFESFPREVREQLVYSRALDIVTRAGRDIEAGQ